MGGKLSGSCVEPSGRKDHPLTAGTVDGDHVTFTHRGSFMLNKFDVNYAGVRDGDQITGRIDVFGHSGDFIACARRGLSPTRALRLTTDRPPSHRRAMNVLLIGSGGREHALAWKIAQSPLLTRLVAAPGNPGIAAVCEMRDVSVTDVQRAGRARPGNRRRPRGGGAGSGAGGRVSPTGWRMRAYPCFGPTRGGGATRNLKSLFQRISPSVMACRPPRHLTFGDAANAKLALDKFKLPYVIKADGLAAGKGVVIAK